MSNRMVVLAMLAFVGMVCISTSPIFAHGDVTPQPIDTAGLAPLKEGDWLKENPYRGNETAKSIGASGYNQNCARCHGLEGISGGLAPDLRYLEDGATGDDWFMQRIRHGAKKPDGATMMPAFEGLINQEAMWAIRTYLETVPKE